ncbi:unnamed protein product [Arabidopsis lyrata]|nr:unnamed protein product [Arabidopsis lyrata]
MEEEKKNKALSEEVMKLKDLFQEKHLCGRSQDSETPGSTLITTTRSKKRSRQSKDTVEMDMISPQVSHHNKKCCKTNYDTSSVYFKHSANDC